MDARARGGDASKNASKALTGFIRCEVYPIICGAEMGRGQAPLNMLPTSNRRQSLPLGIEVVFEIPFEVAVQRREVQIIFESQFANWYCRAILHHNIIKHKAAVHLTIEPFGKFPLFILLRSNPKTGK